MATRPIDEKIVAMRMDNSDFMRKASETTKSLGGLTSLLNKIPGINIGRTTSELQNIQKSVNGIETSNLSNAIDLVTRRFSTMGIVATTALVNITNKAVDAGLSMVRNLTVAPILDGFREYETKIGSIQTILANTARHGTSLKDVTSSLEELNKYADKTIYNFGQMTKNIGLFTNAGLKLEESTSMIKGFANAAASSGAGAEEMARAAYQMSQGLSNGYLITQDWLSLTNAGMGNDNMRRDLIALGQAMGTLGRSTSDTLQNWKESLSDDKWLTKEVFSTYLQAMAGDLDKATLMTKGLTEAQADMLLQNAKTGEEAATKVRTFTQMIGTIIESIGSGWSESWEIIFGGFNDATKLWSGFAEIISEPFNNLTKSRNNFLKSLKDQGVFEDIFVGIGTAIYLVGKALTAVTGGFSKAFSSDKVGLVKSLVDGFKNLISAITPSQKSLENISLIFQAIGSTVRVVIKILKEVGSLFARLIPDNLAANVLSMLGSFAKIVISFNEAIINGNGLRAAFKGLGNIFSWMGDRIGDVGNGLAQLGKIMLDFWTTLTTGEESADSSFSKDSKVIVWMTAIGDAIEYVINGIKNLKLSLSPISNAFSSFFSTIHTGFSWLREKLSGIGKSIQDSMPSGTTLFAGGFVAALVAITGIILKRVNDITKIFGGVGKVIQGFAENLESVSGVLNSFSLSIKANALLTVSIAIGALAVSILLLSRVNGAEIGNSLTAIVGSLTAVIGAMAVINKYGVTGGIRASTSIIGMAVALSVMSIALKQFGSLNPKELTTGLIGLVTVMGALAGAFALMGKFNTKGMSVSALQIVAMSVSVLIIAKAVKDMASLNPAELAKGVAGLAAVLGSIAGAFALMGKFGGKGISASALQLVAIAGSVIILVGAIKMISKIKTADLIKGLATITAILGVVAGFAKLTSGKNLLSSAAGILAIAIAMNALIIPIFALGNIPIEKLGVGLLGMSVALLAIAAASSVMSGSLVGAVSIMAMAVALNILLVPILAFAAMGWGPMLTGVAGLAISLGVLAGVSLLLAPATIPLLAFSAAIGIMGVAMLAGGAGMALFGTGLVALAGMSVAAITAVVAAIGTFITGLISLIPTAVKFVIEIIKQIAIAIRDNAPEIIGIIAEIIIKIIEKLAEYVPKFVKATVQFLTAWIDSLAEEGPKVVKSAVNLLIVMVETMAKTIDEEGPRFVNAFLDMFAQVLTLIVQAGVAVIKALVGWIPGVRGAMNDVSDSAEDAIAEYFDAAKIAEDKGQEFADGLASKKETIRLSAVELSKSAEAGLKSGDAKTVGETYATDFSAGMMGSTVDVHAAAKRIANAADGGVRDTLDINSPSEVGKETGGYYGEGVAIGMDDSTPLVEKSSKNMADGAMSGLDDVTEMVRDKLFLKKDDVKENEKQAVAVGDSYDKLSKNTEKSAKKSAKSREEILREAFQKDKEWIDDRKYYNQMSLDQELIAWQNLQKKYREGTEERKQIDREVYRVQQALIKAKVDAEKEAFNKSKEWIDEKKTYNDLSLTEELAAWERVQSRYKQGTEERKQADHEIYRLKNEINDKLIALNDEYTSKVLEANQKLIDGERELNAEYEKAVNDRTKALTDFAGLFDSVTKNSETTGQQLVDNLKSQVDTIAQWFGNIQVLAARGVDDGLIDELKQMGPKAAGEVAALNTLTDAQLSEYVGLWKTKNAIARAEATIELEGMKTDTTKKIEELRVQTATDLEILKKEWINKITEIRKGTGDQFVKLKDDMTTIGTNAMKGLETGMANMTPSLLTQAKNIADSIAATIRSALDIHSPSRVLMGLGEYATQGLAVGMVNASGRVVDSAKSLAETAKDSLNKFLKGFDVPESDNELHFKAVIEYDKIDPSRFGPNQLSIAPDTSFTNNTIAATRLANRQNGDTNPTVETKTSGEVAKQTVINQNLTFNSRQLTPSEVARKNLQASRQLAMNWGT